ncbi:cobalt ECF transporter T component CbiQ [Geomesophilobacter sediminis]|uniref:Cobalt ECF transporter T component CbiQ n=1 Tax=Geomesophilobacter sediminis TaxID=2798584 RepID=A0A8J7LWR4_9BACT|nr:cobalt ECF transporter T component CbiQ [Geomesophilobacter sediminis]MBJ6726145.1 cobalt ECF transporter T component CbiQ [Geomesophilobacter sediminis]
MTSIEGALLDFKRLDRLAAGDTALHRLDPRAKVIVTFVFIVTVVSFGRYELSALVPFFLFPAILVGLGNLPAGYLARKVALLCPFALVIGLFNPLFDRAVALQLGPLAISAGWISCASIVVRAALTVGAAFVLLALTGFPAICSALERLGLPGMFVVQLHFLYRYIFVLGEEGGQASRALELRSFGAKRPSLATYGSLVGHLLLRTWLRAERVHRAMLARGFSGAFPTRTVGRFGMAEAAFVAGWTAFFLFLRLNNGAQLLGSLLTGHFS